MAKGIRERHARSCRSLSGGRCGCEPTYEGYVWNPAKGKQERRTFRDQAEARGWVRDAKIALRRGRTLVRPTTTLQGAWDAWLEGARNGAIRTRSGELYKPASLRNYELALRLRILPTLGREPISDLSRTDLQGLSIDCPLRGARPARSTLRSPRSGPCTATRSTGTV